MPQGLITYDSKKYITEGPVQRTMLPPSGFPEAQPPAGQPSADNFLLSKLYAQAPPLGIGLRYGKDPRRIWDAEADTRFASGIYLPRLKTTTTFPAEVAAVEYRRIRHGIGELFLLGDGNSTSKTADEGILYFDGTNWVDSTAKDDICVANGSGSMDAADGVEHEGAFYVCLRGQINGYTTGPHIYLIKATSATSWDEVNNADSNSVMGACNNIAHGLDGTSSDLFVTTVNPYGNINVRKSTDDGTSWSTLLPIRSSDDARGMAVFGDGSSSPVDDLWIGTAEGLWHVDVSGGTARLVVPFQHPSSSHSGQVKAVGPGLLFTDGPNVFLGNWVNNQFRYEELGPACIDDGLPLAKQGDITAISYDNIRDELACAIGGGAASKHATIYIYNFAQRLWHCMYKNSTADKAIFAIEYSSETDGVNRLHFVEDNATDSDSDAFYLNYISDSPESQTSATFATSGTVTTSRFNGFVDSLRSGFLKTRWRADSLEDTSNEYLSVKTSINGDTLSAAQNVTTSPVTAIWVGADGASSAGGQGGYDISIECTLNRGGSSANTDTPKVRAFSIAYEPKALKDDGTPPFIYRARISRDPDANRAIGRRPELVLSDLDASYAKAQLLTLTFKEGGTSVSTRVKMLPYQVEQTPSPIAGGNEAISEWPTIPVTWVEVA